ncbi:12595_t:CDS:2, partial [Acaulospora colombiana]
HSISMSVKGIVETSRKGRPRIDSRLSGIGEVMREMGDLYGTCMTKMIPVRHEYEGPFYKFGRGLETLDDASFAAGDTANMLFWLLDSTGFWTDT